MTLGLFWELVGVFGFKKGFQKEAQERDQDVQNSFRMSKKCFERTQDEQSWGKMGSKSDLGMVSGAFLSCLLSFQACYDLDSSFRVHESIYFGSLFRSMF